MPMSAHDAVEGVRFDNSDLINSCNAFGRSILGSHNTVFLADLPIPFTELYFDPNGKNFRKFLRSVVVLYREDKLSNEVLFGQKFAKSTDGYFVMCDLLSFGEDLRLSVKSLWDLYSTVCYPTSSAPLADEFVLTIRPYHLKFIDTIVFYYAALRRCRAHSLLVYQFWAKICFKAQNPFRVVVVERELIRPFTPYTKSRSEYCNTMDYKLPYPQDEDFLLPMLVNSDVLEEKESIHSTAQMFEINNYEKEQRRIQRDFKQRIPRSEMRKIKEAASFQKEKLSDPYVYQEGMHIASRRNFYDFPNLKRGSSKLNSERRLRHLYPFLVSKPVEFSYEALRDAFINFTVMMFNLGWFRRPRSEENEIRRLRCLDRCIFRGTSLPRINEDLSFGQVVPRLGNSLPYFLLNFELFRKTFGGQDYQDSALTRTFQKYKVWAEKGHREMKVIKSDQELKIEREILESQEDYKREIRYCEAQMFNGLKRERDDFIDEGMDKVKEKIPGVLDSVWDQIFERFSTGVTDFIHNFPTHIENAFKTVVDSLNSDMVSNLFNYFHECFVSMRHTISGVWTSMTGDRQESVVPTIIVWILVIFGIWTLVQTLDVTFSLAKIALIKLMMFNGFDVPSTLISRIDDMNTIKIEAQSFGMMGTVLGAVVGIVLCLFDTRYVATAGGIANLMFRGAPFFESGADMLSGAIDAIYFKLFDEHLFSSKEDLRIFEEYLERLEKFFKVPNVREKVLRDPKFTKELQELMADGYTLKKMFGAGNTALATKYLQMETSLTMLWDEALAQADMFKSRIETVSLWLYGKPGQGKTELLKMLPHAVYQNLQKRYGKEDYTEWKPSQMYERTKGSLYWEGYYGNWGCAMNEIFTHNDPAMKAVEAIEFLNCCEETVFPLNMAFAQKGKSFFRSELLVITTNFSDGRLGEIGITNPEALVRRRTFPLEVVRGDEIAEDYSNRNEAWRFFVNFPDGSEGGCEQGLFKLMFWFGLSRYFGLHPACIVGGKLIWPEGPHHKQFMIDKKYSFTFDQVAEVMTLELIHRKSRPRSSVNFPSVYEAKNVQFTGNYAPNYSMESVVDLEEVEKLMVSLGIVVENEVASVDCKYCKQHFENKEKNYLAEHVISCGFKNHEKRDNLVKLGEFSRNELLRAAAERKKVNYKGQRKPWVDYSVGRRLDMTPTISMTEESQRSNAQMFKFVRELIEEDAVEPPKVPVSVASNKQFLPSGFPVGVGAMTEFSDVQGRRYVHHPVDNIFLTSWPDLRAKRLKQTRGLYQCEYVSHSYSYHFDKFITLCESWEEIKFFSRGLRKMMMHVDKCQRVEIFFQFLDGAKETDAYLYAKRNIVGLLDQLPDVSSIPRWWRNGKYLEVLAQCDDNFEEVEPGREHYWASDLGMLLLTMASVCMSGKRDCRTLDEIKLKYSRMEDRQKSVHSVIIYQFSKVQSAIKFIDKPIIDGFDELLIKCYTGFESLKKEFYSSSTWLYVAIGSVVVAGLSAAIWKLVTSYEKEKFEPTKEDLNMAVQRSYAQMLSKYSKEGVRSQSEYSRGRPEMMNPFQPGVVSQGPYNRGGVESMNPFQTRVSSQANIVSDAQSFLDEVSGKANKAALNVVKLRVNYSSGSREVMCTFIYGSVAVGVAHFFRCFGVNFSSIEILGIGDLPTVKMDKAQIHLDFFDKDCENPGGFRKINGVRDLCLLYFNPVLLTSRKSLFNALPMDKNHLCPRAGIARVHRHVLRDKSTVVVVRGEDTIPYAQNSRSLENDYPGGSVLVDHYYQVLNARGDSGDCSLPYLNLYPTSGTSYIEGFHIGSSSKDAFMCPLYQNDFEFVWNFQLNNWAPRPNFSDSQSFYDYPPLPEDVYLTPELEKQFENPEFLTSDGAYHPLGTHYMGSAPSPAFMPKETCLKPSVFQGDGNTLPPLYELENAPARLKSFTNREGEIVQPLNMAKDKLPAVPKRSLPNWVVGLFAAHPELLWEGFVPPPTVPRRRFRRFTIEDVIFGIPGILEPIDLSTAPGFFLKGKKLKRRDVINYDTRWISPILLEELERIVQAVREGKLPKLVTVACLKDELRDLERVRLGKTRMFHVGDFAMMIWIKMVLGDVMCFLKEHKHFTDCAIGTNPHGFDWSMWGKRLQQIVDGLNGGGDFSGFDTGLMYAFAYLMGLCFLKEYGYPPSSLEAREVLYACLSTIGPIMQIGKHYYWFDYMNPSGGFMTGVINTFTNIVMFKIIWIKLQAECRGSDCGCGFADADWVRDFMKLFYGDDNAWLVNAKYGGHISMTSFAKEFMELFGMSYTTASKEAVTVDHLPFNEVEFLKRKFVFDGYFCLAPLDKASIKGMLMWVRDTKTSLGNIMQLQQNIDVAAMEMTYYGRGEWYSWANKVKEYCALCNVNFTGHTYEYYYERLCSGYSQ